ncbi:MAG: hypothetical protein HYZ50_05685 [Deltaproteobacteria bacterium]|nr:hypothetical protein [Deltaproteobacteria bacterium]
MNTPARPTDGRALHFSSTGPVGGSVFPQAVPQPEGMTWIDLSGADRLTLDTVQERYGLPPEAITYFLLRHQSTKVIHAGSALFLVTFLALPSRRSLFTPQELKLCVTSTRVVTWCGPSGRGQPALARRLPGLPSLGAQGVGPCLCGLLTGVVASYETIANLGENRRFLNGLREEQQWRDKRTEKFLRFLHGERVFLGHVARESKKLLATEEHQQLLHLEERVGALARRVWSAARRQGDEATSAARARVGNGGRDT